MLGIQEVNQILEDVNLRFPEAFNRADAELQPEQKLSLSVTIVTYKRPQTLKATLGSVLNQQTKFNAVEIVVVDNDKNQSAEQVVEELRSELPHDWKLDYAVEPRAGKNYALNRAVSHGTNDLIVTFDDDVILPVDLLQTYHDAAIRWPKAAAFGGKIENVCPGGIPRHCEVKGPNRLYLAWPEHDLGTNPCLYKKGQNPMGANRAIRRSYFKESGFKWNESHSQSGVMLPQEDMQFGLGAHEYGAEMMYIPEARVFHMVDREVFGIKRLWKRHFHVGRLKILTDSDKAGVWKRYRYVFKSLILNVLRLALNAVTLRFAQARFAWTQMAEECGMIREILLKKRR